MMTWNQDANAYLNEMTRIVIPQAPKREITYMARKYKLKKDETERNSWFDMMTNQFNKYDDEITGENIFFDNDRFFN